MAAYVQDVSTWATTPNLSIGGTRTVSITPTAGNLLVVIAACSGTNTAPTITDSQSGTYTLAVQCTRVTSGHFGGIFVRDAAVPNATATTVTFTANAADTGGGLNVIEISGMSKAGSAAVQQTGKQDNASANTTPTVAMGTGAFLTGNMGIGMVHSTQNSTTSAVPPASWTERRDEGYATPTSSRETCTVDSGETGSTITWGGTVAATYGAAVLELDTSSGGPTQFDQSLVLGLTGTTAVIRQTNKVFAPGLTATTSVIKQTSKLFGLSSTYTPALAPLKLVIKALTLAATYTTAVSRQAQKVLGLGMTATTAQVRRIGKVLGTTWSNTLGFVASRGAQQFTQGLAVSATFTVGMTKRVGKALVTALTSTFSLIGQVLANIGLPVRPGRANRVGPDGTARTDVLEGQAQDTTTGGKAT